MKIWTGRYWMTNAHATKISKSLKVFYKTHKVWNKGKQLVENPVTNKTRRTDKKYYLKELELNASREFRYRSVAKAKRDRMLSKKRADRCGYFGRQDWTQEEVTFLKNNYKSTFIEKMAIELERSLSSIEHKLSKLRLIKNHKWK